MEPRAFHLMLALRVAYALIILIAAAQQRWDAVMINAPVFIGSIFLPYLGRRDPRYYALDAYCMAVFAVFALIPHSAWPMLREGELFGFDKLFHMAGGVGLGWFALLLYERHIRSRPVLAISILLAVLALGAAWEVFEWVLWLLEHPGLAAHNLTDTILDLIADTLGGLLVVAYRFK